MSTVHESGARPGVEQLGGLEPGHPHLLVAEGRDAERGRPRGLHGQCEPVDQETTLWQVLLRQTQILPRGLLQDRLPS